MNIPSIVREHVIKPVFRSTHWHKLRKQHIRKYPACACCGKSGRIQVHHVLPVSLHPELELDENNLITLCAKHHLAVGHLERWDCYNPHVREDAVTLHERFKFREQLLSQR